MIRGDPARGAGRRMDRSRADRERTVRERPAPMYTRDMTDESTVFSRILDGELPCHRVFEDAHMLAILDINPLSRGHVLVISKQIGRAHV